MKKLLILILLLASIGANSQTLLTEAADFHVKTIDGIPIFLFPILDDSSMIVAIDFFSTTCGPCQDFAPDFQQSYEDFGSNTGNVYHMGINWGNDNQGVREFDSIFGLTFPSVSGTQGGGNNVFLNVYFIQSYPTVIVIKPDHEISNQYIWEPTTENINNAIMEAGGIMVGETEIVESSLGFDIYPNPAKNIANIKINTLLQQSKIEIISSNGQIVYTNEKITGRIVNVDLANYGSGLYFVRMISNDGIVQTKKLLVN